MFPADEEFLERNYYMLLRECQTSLQKGCLTGKNYTEVLDCERHFGFAGPQRHYFARIANRCSYVLHETESVPFHPSGAEHPRKVSAGGVCDVSRYFGVKPFPKGLAGIHLFLGEYYRDTGHLEVVEEVGGK